MRIIYAIVLLVASLCRPALAQEDTDSGKELYEGCKANATSDYKDVDRFVAGYCAGMLEALRYEGGLDTRRWCIPFMVMPQQDAKVIVAYMDKYPFVLKDLPLQTIIALAFADAWPCSN